MRGIGDDEESIYLRSCTRILNGWGIISVSRTSFRFSRFSKGESLGFVSREARVGVRWQSGAATALWIQSGVVAAALHTVRVLKTST